MPALKHSILLSMTVLLAYFFLQILPLRQYSLQLFALLTAIYLFLQKRKKGRIYYIFPENSSFNLAFINLALLLLIGDSGGVNSPFFVLTFIQLFFIALACQDKVAILLSLEIAVFYLALISNLSDLNFSLSQISNLLAIPIVTLFYLFGKNQYQQAYYRSLLLDSEKRERLQAQADDLAVANFVDNLLNRRLPMLEYLFTFPRANEAAMKAEIQVLKKDLASLIKEINQKEKNGQNPQQEAEEIVKEVSETKD